MVATDSLKFHTSLDGLTEGEIYYLRAYAINDIDTYYGNEVQVKLNYFVDSLNPQINILLDKNTIFRFAMRNFV